ncbi:zinc finger protein 40 [Alosa sapidissima]|uniref:zinc finger protein 40 n=1 Tax=Alosa sapidissima TaxID=34773 RepID=UPI001C0A347C|nr:zinc finger protein 40 [Alosa sapidissima]XP_041932192.1 zinc finger protein 40 [Alosa sapidissima]XP_041932194.1 zinc finger protein 40 [Alosa sapidissima]
MPRTKQNHPKNLKDKIEEAQKELKAPKSTHKGISEGTTSLRGSDGIKGLKRKKVVAENQLKKIPKSPVKKPSQAKNPVPTPGTASVHISNSPSREDSPSSTSSRSTSSSFPNSPSCSLDSAQHHQDADDGQHQQVAPSPHKVTTEEGEVSSFTELQPQNLQACSGDKSNSCDSTKESWGEKLDSEGTSTTAHPSAPLDVLLKAMEPDFNTLTERKTVGHIQKPGTSGVSHSGIHTAMTAVKFGLPPQHRLMQAYDTAKHFYPGPHMTPQPGVPDTKQHQAAYMHPTSQQYMTLGGEHQSAKPAFQKSYSAGQSTAMTHAPIPSGSTGLPQSQPPVVQTCQSLSASVPSTIQVPVTPGYNPVQVATVVNFGSLEQVCSITSKEQKPKKQGKYVCEYCNRACAKPSVLLKHIRSHTGERPYPCVTCGFSFKTKSNLYKHKKSHAHAIKLGLTARSDSQSQSQESDKGLGTHSDVDESGESDEEGSTADLDPDLSQSSASALSDSSLLSLGTVQGGQGESDHPVVFETLKPVSGQKGIDKVTAPLPKVVVYPVNVSPLRADSPRVTDLTPEQATAQRQRECQAVRTVLSSLKEVDCSSPLQDSISEDEDPQGKSPGGGHAQLQRQQATDCSQQQQGKCLLSPRSLGSTDSGYFSRSESADQAMSPPSPFVKITPPADNDVTKNLPINPSPIVVPLMHATNIEKTHILEGQMRPPLDSRTLSLEERISKLISDNEAVVDDKQLDSVKPRRTSLSRRGSIDSPKSYIFKDSFQFDLKPFVRRSSSSSDIPKSPFTPTEKSKPVFLLSVPPQYPNMDCLPITRSNSMPTTPGHSALPPNVLPQPHPLRICHSFDDKISSFNDDVFSSAPSTPNPSVHSRTLVRQIAVEDSTNEGLPSVRSMDEGYHGPSIAMEMQRSKSFEHGNRKPQQNKGTMFECETCRNRYRKRENFENHKKFYCSELHGPKNKPIPVREPEPDVFVQNVHQPLMGRAVCHPGIVEQPTMIRKRRKLKSFGDDDDQSPTDKNPPCSRSFDSCQIPSRVISGQFTQRAVVVNLQPANNTGQIPPGQLITRVAETPESRLSPARDSSINTPTKERGEMQRQGSGTSVIRHTNSLSRPNSFETYESIDQSSPVDPSTKDIPGAVMPSTESSANTALQNYHKEMSIPKVSSQDKYITDTPKEHAPASENAPPIQQSRLVRQNNIQVPEILVTEEPDREHESQVLEQVEKPADTFNWPQRSESLSKLPTEKLPPKKKRIRLAQMEQSSGESSFESSLSRSLSRDSSLSRCSSMSASFERDEPPRSDSPSRESVTKPPDIQGPSTACNTLSVPVMMRRAASEQISCTQPSIAISCDYRSKSFDCSSMSPNRSPSPLDTAMLKSPQPAKAAQVPLIERRRGPLVRQMSLKIGPESQQFVGKQHTVSLQRAPSSNIVSVPQHRPPMIHRPNLAQPFVLHSGEPQKNEHVVQSINLGSQTQHPQIQGLPHPWHQTSRVVSIQKVQPAVQVMPCQADLQSKPAEPPKSFVPKYQLQYPVLKSQTYSFSGPKGTQIALPVITIPIGNEIVSVSKAADEIQNVYVAQQNLQTMPNRTSIVLPLGIQGDAPSQNQSGSATVPQILITHEQVLPPSSVACKANSSSVNIATIDNKSGPEVHTERQQVQVQPGTNTQSHIDNNRSTPSLGSLHCTQKLASVNLCPQQEPIASSKRMLSPANSLDIAMEKHQKRAKDEHGAMCQPTDGRSLSYLNSKMAEVTRQRKLTLVRQVCTTEPADSPIETEAPQDLEKLDPGKDFPAPDTGSTTTPEITAQMQDDKPPSPTDHPMQSPVSRTSPGVQSYPVPANAAPKPQEKSEEQRWSSGKSPLRPPTFQGQVKLASSVSVVNTRDSHRLSFPSLKTATTFTWCYLIKRRPLHVPQTDQRASAYSAWPVSQNNPNPLGLPTKVVMSLFDSKQKSKKIHYTQAKTTSLKSDILTYSSNLKDIVAKVLITQKSISTEGKSKTRLESRPTNEADRESLSKAEPRRIKIFDGGYKSNEEYVYVRGRGRGKYICEECGIRCKKPSMLRKHIRTHSDVRPYHCTHCNFSFKTKGNLTKHMKSKAHSKKCLEMGVSVGLIEDQDAEDSGDRGRGSSADRPDSDGDDSDGPEDEDNDGEEEDEEDSQAESGLSATPSVSASPQHFGGAQHDVAPSSLLAQMSISSSQLTPPPPPPPPPPSQLPHTHTHALPHTQNMPQTPSADPCDSDSVAMLSPVSPTKQMTISAMILSPTTTSSFTHYPLATHTTFATATTTSVIAPSSSSSDPHGSDTESVHMMSPVSPCRQMSIDYPDFDVPPSPPAPGKGSAKLGQGGSACPPAMSSSESGVPVDRGTQTSSFAPQGHLHFPSPGPMHLMGESGAHTHLFSHLPLHSQQPSRSPYSMVPVGGIQLVPAGLAAYSTFVPIQAGQVQLTIPAVSVIHRNTSPLPGTGPGSGPGASPPRPGGSPSAQPSMVVQESMGNMLPCFPLGQMAGIQTLGASQSALQSMGLEALGVMGLANSGLAPTQLLQQQNLALNATLGVQVLAASPAVQSSMAPQTHIPGLQILNIALPALIPSLSPLSTLSPLPSASPEKLSSPEASAGPGPGPSTSPSVCAVADSTPVLTLSASPPVAAVSAAPMPPVVVTTHAPRGAPPCRSSSGPGYGGEAAQPVACASERKGKSPPHQARSSPASLDGASQTAPTDSSTVTTGGASEARSLHKHTSPRPPALADDCSEASSDDEDRLVIAT